MTPLLIDTRAMIWFAAANPAMSSTARVIVDDRFQAQVAGVASLWEMAIKVRLGKLTLRAGSQADFVQPLADNDVAVPPVVAEDAIAVTSLPAVSSHQDPFDRL